MSWFVFFEKLVSEIHWEGQALVHTIFAAFLLNKLKNKHLNLFASLLLYSCYFIPFFYFWLSFRNLIFQAGVAFDLAFFRSFSLKILGFLLRPNPETWLDVGITAFYLVIRSQLIYRVLMPLFGKITSLSYNNFPLLLYIRHLVWIGQ